MTNTKSSTKKNSNERDKNVNELEAVEVVGTLGVTGTVKGTVGTLWGLSVVASVFVKGTVTGMQGDGHVGARMKGTVTGTHTLEGTVTGMHALNYAPWSR